MRQANARPIDQALHEYIRAGKVLANHLVWATLVYDQQIYVINTWVRGAGYNGLYDFS